MKPTSSFAGPVAIDPMTPEHWPAVQAIYAAGIATGHATLESEPPVSEQFDATRLGPRRVRTGPSDRKDAPRRSDRVHRSVGCRTLGTRERVGKLTYGPLRDAWRDVVLIERRSALAGS